MKSVPRNVILDLLPAYIAGEVSEESKILIESFADNDPQIAKMIHTGKLEPEFISQSMVVPSDLEMKTIRHVRHKIRLQIWYIAFATAIILSIPLIAMQYTKEVNWGLLDFIVMGILLFSTGIAYVLIIRASESFIYRIAVGVAVLAVLLLIWMNLAVGIIGSEGNPINLLYFGVVGISIIGAWISRLKPAGMARTMFLTGFIQILIPVILLFFGNFTIRENTNIGFVFGINIFFTVLFMISAILFKNSSNKQLVA